jgi:hypothetical protein
MKSNPNFLDLIMDDQPPYLVVRQYYVGLLIFTDIKGFFAMLKAVISPETVEKP